MNWKGAIGLFIGVTIIVAIIFRTPLKKIVTGISDPPAAS